MSYLRPLSLQPQGLRQSAMDAWNAHLIQLIRDAQILCRCRRSGASPSIQSFSDSLKVLRNFDESDGGKDLTTHLDAEALHAYVERFLPASVQEESFHRGAQLLRKELDSDMFPRYFRLLWKPHFRHLDLPPISEADHRIATLDFIVDSFAGGRQGAKKVSHDDAAGGFLETAKLRLFETCEIGIEESYLLKRVARTTLTANLTVLLLWWVCDDQLLNIIGASCRRLESLDVWRSAAVTDVGVKMLFAASSSCSSSSSSSSSSGLCRTLKRLVVKETSCTHVGCLVAMNSAVGLESLSFSHATTMVNGFFEELRNAMCSSEASPPPSFSLRTLFLPVADGTDFEDVIRGGTKRRKKCRKCKRYESHPSHSRSDFR